MTPRAVVGRWISIAAHPFALIPAAIAVATSGQGVRVRGPILGVVIASMIVLAVYVLRRLRRGEVTDVDVSARTQRPAFYAVAFVSMMAAAAALHVSGQSRAAVAGAAVAAGLLAAGAVANMWVKASLHCAFAALATGIAWRAGASVALVFGALALVLAWARVAYGRHTVVEVAVGLALGGAAAIAYVTATTI